MYDACTRGVTLKRSTTAHSDDGFSCLAVKHFEAIESVSYYHGTLYAHCGSQLKEGNVYGSGIMSSSSDEFPIWAMCHKNMVEAPDVDQKVWNIPAMFSIVRFINKPGRLLSEVELTYHRNDLQWW